MPITVVGSIAYDAVRTPFGERAFSILLFQDLSIVPMITLIAAMSRNPADVGGPPSRGSAGRSARSA